jgi:chemotaxis protein CheZ
MAARKAKSKKSAKPAGKAPARRKPKSKTRAKPARRKPVRQAASPVQSGISRLAQIIADAKRDLAALSAQEIGRKHLPTAGDELTAIVRATEAATNAILDAVERIEKAAADAPAAIAQPIAADVTAIYEACNFQDITGQRISKIVAVLKEVDVTVADLLATLNLPPALAAAPAPAPAAKTGEAALLNGPQLPAGARDQAEIDALFDKA